MMNEIENLKPLKNKQIIKMKNKQILMLQNHGSWFGFNLEYCIGDTAYLYEDCYEKNIDHLYSSDLKRNNKTFIMFDVSKLNHKEKEKLINKWSNKYKLENLKNGKMFDEFQQ